MSAPTVETSASAAPPAQTPDYATRVLLVDDQVMIGEAVRRALAKESNFEFKYCNDPGDAVQMAEVWKPTVILQDLVMPGIDGLTLLRRYRETPATQNIPVVVLSTKEEPATKSEAFSAGANDYLIKLPDAIELIARVRHHSKAYIAGIWSSCAFSRIAIAASGLFSPFGSIPDATSIFAEAAEAARTVLASSTIQDVVDREVRDAGVSMYYI